MLLLRSKVAHIQTCGTPAHRPTYTPQTLPTDTAALLASTAASIGGCLQPSQLAAQYVANQGACSVHTGTQGYTTWWPNPRMMV